MADERLQVIDAHHHVGVSRVVGFDDHWMRADLAKRRGQMGDMGIDRCVILPVPGAAGGFRNVDHARMNDAMAAYSACAADLVVGACATVNPVEPAEACRELERAFGDLDMPAVAFHHRYLGMMIDEPSMDDIVRVAHEWGRTVFVHIISDSTFEAAWRLFALARRFPDARFLALDGFSSAAQAMMLRERAPDFPNIWFDTGAMTSVAHQMELFLEACGAGRLVLGTDCYSGHPHFRVPFSWVELQALGLPQADIEAIVNRNIVELLTPPGVGAP